MTGFSYAVVANCQARPISSAIELMTMGSGRNVGIVITHLAKNQESDANMEMLAKADLIFAQAVQQSYPVSHVVTQNLRREFGEKLITWPNMFFTGHSPGLCYVNVNGGRRIVGPLHEYQYRPVFESWQEGLSVDECLSKVEKGIDSGTLLEDVARSFTEIRSREAGLDVIASDLIEDNWQRNRFFFTFNHPSANLILRCCARLLEKAGVKNLTKITPDIFGEPLGKIVPPISEADAVKLGLEFDITDASKGLEVIIQNGKVTHGKSKIYSLRELVEASYSALDAQKESIKDVRYTPA